MDFAIDHPCLYDKIKAICFEVDDKIYTMRNIFLYYDKKYSADKAK